MIGKPDMKDQNEVILDKTAGPKGKKTRQLKELNLD